MPRTFVLAWNTSTLDFETGDAGNIDLYYRADGAEVGLGNPTEWGGGVYYYDLTDVQYYSESWMVRGVSSTVDVVIVPDRGGANAIGAILVSALADLFDVDSGETGDAAVAGSVVGEILTNVNTVAFPAGAVEYTFNVTDSSTGLPIDGAEVWFATDAAYANVVWKGETDAFGDARDVNNDKPMLDAGTYYYRTQHANYGANEGTVVVS